MSFEGHPKNSFRASVQGAGTPSPLIKSKKKTRDSGGGGLDAIGVPRNEARRVNERARDRHRLTEEQALVRFKKKSFPVELINVSRGGAMIEGTFRAKLWDRLELELGDSGALECVVRWVRGRRFGLEFAHETRIHADAETVDAMLRAVICHSFPEFKGELGSDPLDPADEQEADAEQSNARGAVRHPLIWRGILHHDYEWEAVRLRNISTAGALVECAAEFPTDVTVYLDLGSAGRLAASVCWSRGSQTGLRFDEPFDIHQLAAATPEIVSAEWVMPDYLDPDGRAPVPAAEPWQRASIEQLSRSLGG